MNDPKQPERRWSPRAYLWEGGSLAFGYAAGRVPPHSHHAVQITIGLDGPVQMSGEAGEWAEYEGVVVRANAVHSFDGGGSLIMMLFVDPESLEGRWLHDTFAAPVAAIPTARLEQCRPALLDAWTTPPSADEAANLVVTTARAICTGMPASRRLDDRLVDALALIRSTEASRLSLDEVARSVHLSPSRFQHLFKDELGIPFRRYILWRRLTRAIVMVSRGETLSSAAHGVGFSDSAHLTRTCYQMYGIPPTSLIGGGDLYEIQPPFERGEAALK